MSLVVRMDWEDEEVWLVHCVKRLRAILRFSRDPRIEELLRDLIREADDRIAVIPYHTRRAPRAVARPAPRPMLH